MRPQYESIPLENNSIRAVSVVLNEFDYPYHYHPEYELTYVLASTGVRYVGNHFEKFSKNDLTMVGPGLPHCWINTKNQQTMASALVIQWNKDLLGSDWLQKDLFSAIRRLHEISQKGIKFSPQLAQQIKPQMIAIIEGASLFEKTIGLINILQQLSFSENIKVLCKDDYTNLSITDNERLNKIKQYVSEHYKEKIKLDDMASLSCMANESFSRFFSKMMGKAFFTFLNEYRVEISCKLLIETDLKISNICDQSGFDSLSFFYRQFNRFKNCSPALYREKFKESGTHSMPVIL